jgi:hypothetical protein
MQVFSVPTKFENITELNMLKHDTFKNKTVVYSTNILNYGLKKEAYIFRVF